MKKEATMKVYRKYHNKNCNTTVYLTDDVFGKLGNAAGNLISFSSELYTLINGKYVEIPKPVQKVAHAVNVEPIEEAVESTKKSKPRKTKDKEVKHELVNEDSLRKVLGAIADLENEDTDGLGVIDDLPFN